MRRDGFFTRRRVFWAFLLAGYMAFAFLGGCANKVLLHPTTEAIDAKTALRRVVPFEAGELEVWTSRSPGANGREPAAYVLDFTGNAGRAEQASAHALHWKEKPIELWAVNYPGFGGSTGPADLQRLARAGLAAYDALAQHANTKPIFLNGTSLGTAVALHVAAQRPAAGVVLRSPPPLRDLILWRHGWWNLWVAAGPLAWAVPDELSSMTNAPRVTSPGLFVITGNDEVVPASYQRMVLNAYAGPKQSVLLKDYKHNTLLQGPGALDFQAQLDWLWQQSPAGRSLDDKPAPAR